jgi:hypothetical protein
MGAAIPRASASNCEVTHTSLLAEELSVDGALVIVTSCPGDARGCAGELPAITIERAGVAVQGTLASLYADAHSRWLTFRPAEPWAVGTYEARDLPGSFGPGAAPFEVVASVLPFAFDEAALSLVAEAVVAPWGEPVCCPSNGEGDCRPSCAGRDGEQRVAQLSVQGLPVAPSSVVWSIADRDSDEASWGREQGLRIAEPRSQYCARLEAWDSATDTRQTALLCNEGFDAAAEGVGDTSATWNEIAWDRCSAPPVVGGYGYDVVGSRVPNPAPPVDEALRVAYCNARRASCSDVDCAYYGQYCADGGRGCALASSGLRGQLWAWLAVGTLGALGRRRRRAHATRA